GAVDVGHAARADPALDPVAAVDDGAGVQVPDAQCTIASRTCLAIGAAYTPAWPGAHSSVTATAARGLTTGAKAMNDTWLPPGQLPTSAVPVLPATSMPCSAAAVPVPSLTTLLIICPTCCAVCADIACETTFGLTVFVVRPSWSTARCTR